MRKFYGMLWLLCGVFAFAACSDDEEENGDQGKPLDPSTFRRVEKMVDTDVNADGEEEKYTTVYEYDSKGRLIEVKEIDEYRESDTVVYKNDVVTYYSQYAFSDGDSIIFSLKDGKTENYIHWNTEYGIGRGTCHYTGDYLTKIIGNEEGNGDFSETITWKDGNISNYVYEELDGFDGIAFEYSGNYENKASVDIVSLFCFEGAMREASLLNIDGQRSKYLPTKVIYTGLAEEDGGTQIHNIKYTTDAKGYLTKIESIGESDGDYVKMEIYYQD